MSYRFPVCGSGGRRRLRQREWHLWFSETAGATTAFVLALAFGRTSGPVFSMLSVLAAASIVATMACGVLGAFRFQPLGEVFYPRSDGHWHDLRGRRLIDFRDLVDGARAGPLHRSFAGGFVAATVCESASSRRMVPAGYVPQTLTLLVAAPGARSYRTRLNLQLLPADEERLRSGEVLIALRFDAREPDIALLPPGFAASLIGEDRRLARGALDAALAPAAMPDIRIWDARGRRVLHRGYPQFRSFYRGAPAAIWRDIVARGEWRLWVSAALCFGAGLTSGAILALLV